MADGRIPVTCEDDGGRGRPRPARLLRFAGACLAAMLVLVATQRYGPAVTPDSASYIAAAESLLAGGGFTNYDGAPFADWPPLYPALLALGALSGAEPMQTAPVLNAIALGLVVFCAGGLFVSHTRDARLAWLGFLAVLLSWPLLNVATKVWAETIFIALMLLGIRSAPAFLSAPTWPRLLLFAAPLALATLQRYAGLALVLAGAASIVLLARRISLRSRLRFATAFALLTVAPLVPWLVRNRLLTSTLTGDRTFEVLPIRQSLTHLAETLSSWLVPPVLPVWAGVLLGCVLVAVAIRGFVAHARSDTAATREQDRVMALFVVVYAVFLLASSTVQAASLPDNRLLSPLYVPLVYLVVAGLDRGAAATVSRAGVGRTLGRVAVALGALWLLYPAASVAGYVSIRAAYDTNAWHDSALARWLSEHPPAGELYSNRPWVVYLSAGVHARALPTRDVEAFLSREIETNARPCLIAWFLRTDRGRKHAAGILRELLVRVAGARDSPAAQGLVRSVLDFMERIGLARREETDEGRAGRPAAGVPPVARGRASRLFEDGALYVCAAEGAAGG